MGCYRRAKLALDAFRGFAARIVPKVVAKEPISRAFSTESSTLASNKVKFSGFSWYSSLSQKSIPLLGFTRRTQYTSPFLDSAKRYYYVDRNSVQHFKPIGSRTWFQSPFREPISRAFSTESSTLASNKDKFSGFSWYSSLSQKSIPQLGFTRRTQYTSPFLDSAKRYYYVDRNSVQHFKPIGPLKWFQSPRNVFIVVMVGSGVFITVYFGNLETIPYTNRTHFVILSKYLEKKMGESQFEQLKASFRGKILPAIHPDSVRVRLIAKDIIEALQRGLRRDASWTDLEYASASDRFDPAHEGSRHDTLMTLKDVGEEGKKWSREDEILDNE